MKVDIKKETPCRRRLRFEVPAADVEEESNKLLQVYRKNTSVPGFRKGNAPRKVVKKRFAKEIKKDLEEQLLSRYYQAAVKENELEVLSVIDVGDLEISDGEPMNFEVVVDIPPSFKLPKYKAIKLKSEREDVSEEQIDEAIERIMRQYAEYNDVEDQPVKKNDMAEISFSARLDGKPLNEVVPEAKGLNSADGYWVAANSDSFLPGVGEALVGLQAGDSKEVPVTFKDDFVISELGGKTVQYQIEVSGVREQKMPEMDGELLQKLQVDSEESLRKAISEQLEQRAEQQEKSDFQEQIVKYLLKKTKLGLPESVVQQQTRNTMYEIARQKMQQGTSKDDLANHKEEMLKEATEKAQERVKLHFIANRIAEEEELKVSEQDIQERVATMAVQRGTDASKMRSEMEEKGEIENLREQVLISKVFDLLIEKANLK